MKEEALFACGLPIFASDQDGTECDRTGRYSGSATASLTWETGQTIRIRFLNGNPSLHAAVEQYAEQWLKHANLKFDFSQQVHKAWPSYSTNSSQIRIYFDPTGRSKSYIGTQALKIHPREATMNLAADPSRPTGGSEFQRTVLHEFGHALGLQHGHQSPAGGIQWKKNVVYAHFYARGRDRQWVDHNILRRDLSNLTVHSKGVDKESIMIYTILPGWTVDGWCCARNTTLSRGDKKLIAKLYPYPRAPRQRNAPSDDEYPGAPNTHRYLASQRTSNQQPRLQVSVYHPEVRISGVQDYMGLEDQTGYLHGSHGQLDLFAWPTNGPLTSYAEEGPVEEGELTAYDVRESSQYQEDRGKHRGRTEKWEDRNDAGLPAVQGSGWEKWEDRNDAGLLAVQGSGWDSGPRYEENDQAGDAGGGGSRHNAANSEFGYEGGYQYAHQPYGGEEYYY